MSSKKNVTTVSDLFSEPEETVVEEVPEERPVVSPGGDTRKARIKGTWTMYWDSGVFNFEDGKTYVIPTGLFNYLKENGNIYDTL